MYGVVLMVAMTGGAETPALFKRGGGCCGAATYSCSGYSCSGSSCYGSCTGGRGHKHKRSKGCCGYSSCCGYTACYGAPVACYGSAPVACYGGAPVIGGGDYGTPGVITPMPEDPKTKGKKPEKLKKPPVDNETVEAAPARITITVPSDARVSIDGAVTVSTETTRTFESPTLQVGKSYTYTFQAEFVRDGKEVVVTREVKVKAGSDISVSLENASEVASR